MSGHSSGDSPGQQVYNVSVLLVSTLCSLLLWNKLLRFSFRSRQVLRTVRRLQAHRPLHVQCYDSTTASHSMTDLESGIVNSRTGCTGSTGTTMIEIESDEWKGLARWPGCCESMYPVDQYLAPPSHWQDERSDQCYARWCVMRMPFFLLALWMLDFAALVVSIIVYLTERSKADTDSPVLYLPVWALLNALFVVLLYVAFGPKH